MNIYLVTPARGWSRKGNGVTARRWARILRELGHRVKVEQEYAGYRCDLLLALHARRSHEAIVRFRREHPELPLILALTGTDLYGDIHTDVHAQRSLDLASRLVLLQPDGIGELPERLRPKARVIYQSAVKPPGKFPPRRDSFEVCVLGHMRPVKDPFRTALAARRLLASSRIRVTQIGAALSDELADQACAEMEVNSRYRWLGELPRWRALRLLARSRVHVLTSQLEGGANAMSEAIAAGVPSVSSRISGSIGLLGPDYPGYFPVGDTAALAALLQRVETDAAFYQVLKRWTERLLPLVDPTRERESWAALLRDVTQ
jgi:putative glycosyltransferase (TIGR04348 family)